MTDLSINQSAMLVKFLSAFVVCRVFSYSFAMFFCSLECNKLRDSRHVA